MTNEEKAKAYDEALEKAKEMMDNCSFETTKVVCQELFPELVESEDERIRRTLLEYFGPDVQLDFVRGVAIKKIRDWLEKQKEHQNNSDAREKALGRDLTFPQDKDKNLDEIAQDYVDSVKEYNPEPTWDLMQTAVCYGYHYREWKEQKPAWSEDEETLIDTTIAFLKDFADTGWENAVECIDFLKSLRPDSYKKCNSRWKPSEEQMKALKWWAELPICSPGLKSLYEDLKKL